MLSAYIFYGAAALALLILPRRLKLSMSRIGKMLAIPAILAAFLMLAENRITDFQWSVSELPMIFMLFIYLLAVSFLFLSAPLVVTALTTEYLRLYKSIRGWRLAIAAGVLCLLAVSVLRLPWPYTLSLVILETLLVGWMEYRTPRS